MNIRRLLHGSFLFSPYGTISGQMKGNDRNERFRDAARLFVQKTKGFTEVRELALCGSVAATSMGPGLAMLHFAAARYGRFCGRTACKANPSAGAGQ